LVYQLESVVQASIITVTTAAGRLQDLSHSSLDPGVTIWIVYAGISVLISGTLLVLSYTPVGQTLLPATRLAQVAPRKLEEEVDRLWEGKKLKADGMLTVKEKESILKSTQPMNSSTQWAKRILPIFMVAVILAGWSMFAMGILWGVQGNVVAGTIGE
jgi:hypothetical protein